AIVGLRPPWVRRWALAIGVGLAVALAPVSKALTHHQYRSFWAVFPLRLGYDLLGGQPLAFVLLAPLAVAGVWHHRDRATVRALTMVATLAALVWLVGPEFLYSRYFLWLLPGVAYAVAVSVARRPWLLAVVAVAAGPRLLGQLADMGESPLPNRVAAAVLARAHRQGERTCAIRSSA